MAPEVREAFDFTEHMRRLCADLILRCPRLAHIRLEQCCIACSWTRKPVRYGTWASLTPMRFENGSTEIVRGGQRFTVQRLLNQHDQDFLYIVRFYLPRFLNLSLDESLQTVVHELWHINPEFNGDIRRFDGRCHSHSRRKQDFDRVVTEIVQEYLAQQPPRELLQFLEWTMADFQRRYSGIVGIRVPQPKLIPVPGGTPRP